MPVTSCSLEECQQLVRLDGGGKCGKRQGRVVWPVSRVAELEAGNDVERLNDNRLWRLG